MGTAFRYSLLMLVLAGIVYPLLMTGLGQVLFPHQANGSLITNASGQVIGSELLGQNFTQPQYFHPRPSANNYDASNSGGSNDGPTSKKLIQRVSSAAVSYRKENGLPPQQPVPVDAVTMSASGLDPDISLANAYIQASRVAMARHLPVSKVTKLIQAYKEPVLLGFLGEPSVNVLKINLALDQRQ